MDAGFASVYQLAGGPRARRHNQVGRRGFGTRKTPFLQPESGVETACCGCRESDGRPNGRAGSSRRRRGGVDARRPGRPRAGARVRLDRGRAGWRGGAGGVGQSNRAQVGSGAPGTRDDRRNRPSDRPTQNTAQRTARRPAAPSADRERLFVRPSHRTRSRCPSGGRRDRRPKSPGDDLRAGRGGAVEGRSPEDRAGPGGLAPGRIDLRPEHSTPPRPTPVSGPSRARRGTPSRPLPGRPESPAEDDRRGHPKRGSRGRRPTASKTVGPGAVGAPTQPPRRHLDDPPRGPTRRLETPDFVTPIPRAPGRPPRRPTRRRRERSPWPPTRARRGPG